MPNTTNYNFPTPADTDLVKDGASAIRSLGTAVDTTVKNLNPSTTLGDIEYRSSTANTNTRLGIGTTGQVLTVAGGVPSWATPAGGGGMTLISTTTLSGASVSLSSIPATYNNLQLVIRDYLPATDGTNLRLRVNGDSTASRHYTLNDFTRVATQDFNQASWLVSAAYGNDNSVANSLIVVDILDYANTVTYKIANITGCVVDEGNTALIGAFRIAGFYNQTSAISSLDIFPISGNFTSGTALLYGVK